jgi:hypothetical protein
MTVYRAEAVADMKSMSLSTQVRSLLRIQNISLSEK